MTLPGLTESLRISLHAIVLTQGENSPQARNIALLWKTAKETEQTVNQIITEMQAISNMTDEPFIEEMCENVAQMCSKLLNAEEAQPT